METKIVKAPRCTNHPPMSAVMQCEKCKAFLCRLCTSNEKGIETCTNCRGACRMLSREELGSEAKRQTEMIQNRAAGIVVPPPPVPAKQLTSKYAKPGTNTAAASAPAPAPKSTAAAAPVSKSKAAMVPAAATASAPAASESKDAAAPASPQNPMERKPPYFCKKHERVKATRHCDHCMDDYCDACAKIIEDNPHCPDCGGQLKKLMPDEQGFPPKSMGSKISEALAFPFRGSGKIMILLGAIFMWILHFGGSWGRNFSYIYMLAYVMKLCRTSASGREAPPEWPAFHELGGAWYFFLTKVVSVVPAIIYLAVFTRINVLHFYLADDAEESQAVETRQYDEEDFSDFQNQDVTKAEREARQKAREERIQKWQEEQQAAKLRTKMKLVPYYALTFLGELYVPMALLALILYRSYDVLNPLFVFPSILRVKGDYLVVYITLIVSDFFRIAPIIFEAALAEFNWVLALVVAPLIGALFWLYLTMVYMRVLGALYYFNQKKIGWFENKSEPAQA